MAKIDYEFDHVKKSPGKGGGYFRLIALFVLVAGITAGAIWYFWPRAQEEVPQPPPDEGIETVTGEGDGDGNTPVPGTGENTKGGGEKVVVELPEGGEPPAGENGVGAVPGGEGKEAGTEEAPAGENGEGAPTQTPVKGKPWVGDLPDSANVPESVIPVAKLPDWEKKMTRLDELIGARQYAEAIPLCHELLTEEGVIPNSGEYREIAKALTEANLAVMSGGAQSPELIRHTAQSGESYSRLAAKHHSTIEGIKSVNRVPFSDNNLRVGQRLNIYPGPWSIRVEKSARLLKLYNREKLFAMFDVGLGRMGKTPTASFVISVKVRKPDWYSPDGGVVKYGDPDNPLGEYFLKLAATGTPDRPLLGYGIHGTRDDSDVTRSLSNGCVRMRKGDVEKLYLFVPDRTPVEIVD